MGLASTIILVFDPVGTHDHVFFFQNQFPLSENKVLLVLN
jgi:hypothetical protein